MDFPDSIDEAVAHIANCSAPVIMFDTCSLLDIVRFPKLGCHNHRNILVAYMLGKVEVANVHVIITRVVMDELNKHLDVIQSETSILLRDIDEQHKELHSAMKYLPNAIMGMYPGGNAVSLGDLEIALKLRKIIDGVLNKAICLPNEKDVLTKASHRVVLNKAPSKKGGSGPDCVIIETYLAFVNKLREKEFNKEAYFLTSNKKDFCDAQKKIHSDLARDFEKLKIIYSPDLSRLPISMF